MQFTIASSLKTRKFRNNCNSRLMATTLFKQRPAQQSAYHPKEMPLDMHTTNNAVLHGTHSKGRTNRVMHK